MKAYIGVDSKTKLVHTVLASAANMRDREARPDQGDGEGEGPQQVVGARQGRRRVRRDHECLGFGKVRYRGLAKNLRRLEVTAALANLHIVRRRLVEVRESCR
jgi:IS5 family transposase